jgi:hypothetical protein
VGRISHAVRCVVFDSDWKRVKINTDLVTPWALVALGALKGSEPSMMGVAGASKGQLDATTNLEGGYYQGKQVSMPVSHIHVDLAVSLKNGPPVPLRSPRSPLEGCCHQEAA